jgi:excisionase family DNA binding protein
MIERLLYRPGEVGEAIGVSRARAYELIAAGVIPSIRIGSSIRVPADELRRWIARQVERAVPAGELVDR